jgi:hypothetical protein
LFCSHYFISYSTYFLLSVVFWVKIRKTSLLYLFLNCYSRCPCLFIYYCCTGGALWHLPKFLQYQSWIHPLHPFSFILFAPFLEFFQHVLVFHFIHECIIFPWHPPLFYFCWLKSPSLIMSLQLEYYYFAFLRTQSYWWHFFSVFIYLKMSCISHLSWLIPWVDSFFFLLPLHILFDCLFAFISSDRSQPSFVLLFFCV